MFGSLSHWIDPLLSTRMYLYWKLVPAGKSTVTYQSGFELVYLSALRATGLLVSQFPRAGMDPDSLMFSPYTVVAVRSNVTATDVGVVHVVVVVVVGDPLVKVAGQFVLVAVLYVPVAEVPLHAWGTLLAEVSPQAAGMTELRRMLAVNKAA